MAVEIVTREDLQLLRVQLLNDIRQLVGSTEKQPKEWLKNSEVMKLLKVSASTVQRLRVGGSLRSTKVGGTHYYRWEDIQRLLEKGL